MLRNAKELWLAVLAAILIGILYALVVYWTRAVPAAGDLFGHGLGILGFVLMLMTETLYSLRKRSRVARWGRLAAWLQFHIFTGLVGPFMVLLHTSWKFNGLAGVLTLFTVVIVISGFVGRYVYTRIPRSVEGLELDEPLSAAQAATVQRARRLLAVWHTVHIPIGVAVFVVAFIHIGAALYYATFLR